MVFDVMMPVMDGVTALKELRAAGDNSRDRDAEVAQRVAQFVLFF